MIQLLTKACSLSGHIDKNFLSETELSPEAHIETLVDEIITGTAFKESRLQKARPLAKIETDFRDHQKKIMDFLENAFRDETAIVAKMLKISFAKMRTKLQLPSATAAAKAKTKPAKKSASKASPKAPTKAKPAAEDSFYNVTFTDLDEAMISDFAESFDETRFHDIETALLKFEKTSLTTHDMPILEEDMRDLYRELHSIKGTSRFISAELTERIIHSAEDLLGFVQKFSSKISNEDFEKVISLLLQAIDLAWQLRSSLCTVNSEKSFWHDSTRQAKYREVLGQMHALKKDFDERGYVLTIEDAGSIF